MGLFKQLSPVEQAAANNEKANGDSVFQVDFRVMKQTKEVVAIVGAFNSVKSNDSTETLNAIVREGWRAMGVGS